MKHRLNQVLSLVALLVLTVTPALVHAQSPAVEWARWDANITVASGSDQLTIAETQEVNVTAGKVSKGARTWTTDVTVQKVYVISGGSSTPQQLTQSTSGKASTYKFDSSSNTLSYVLPAPVNSGDSFVVQINYTATSPTTGMVDWRIVPREHDFPVLSSTARIRFPSGQAPDQSLVRVSSGKGSVQVSGSTITIKSTGTIAASQSFAIQIPFGGNVGAAGAGNSNNNTNNDNNNTGNANNSNNGSGSTNPNAGDPISPQLPNAGDFQLPGLSALVPILCVIVCVVGVFLMFGGGKLLRGLLGGAGNVASSGNIGGGNFGGNSGRSSGGGLGQSIIGMIINGILGSILGGRGNTGNQNNPTGGIFGGGNSGNDQNNPLGGLFGGNSGNNSGGNQNDPLGGLFGGANDQADPPAPQPPQSSTGGRGFRSSDNQDRNVGNVGDDKDSGGGASFG